MLNSNFQHVLYTNYAPTDAETQEIRDFCQAPEAEIEALELEISRLEAALNVVLQKRDELQAVVTAHRALLSPIRHLSPELLQNIFVFCLTEFPAMDVTEAPLLLGEICKSWKDIVYSTAELWSYVHAVVPLPNRGGPVLETLKEWLSRSGDRPLHISLFADHTASDIPDFLDLIISFSSRWERINLVLPSNHFQQLDLSFSERSVLLRHLRCFELGDRLADHTWPPPFMHPYSEGDGINPLRLLNLCTNLQHISLRCYQGPFHALLPTSVAAGLYELNVDYPQMFNWDLGQLVTFIAECQNLRKLRICASFDGFVPPDSSLITLPALECLIVELWTVSVDPDPPSHTISFLNQLSTPSLIHLGLPLVLSVNNAATTLSSLFTRSMCSLRTLSLQLADAQMDLRPLLSSLECSTDLRELTINRWDIGTQVLDIAEEEYDVDRFLLELAYTEGRIYCPNLIHLTLAGYSGGLSLTSLLTLVQSRMTPPPGCASLRCLDLKGILFPTMSSGSPSFVLENENPASESLLKLLMELRERGLTVLLPDPINSAQPTPWTGLPHQPPYGW